MNSKTKSIIIVLVTVIAAAVILGLLLLTVVADKSGKTEDTTLGTTKDNTFFCAFSRGACAKKQTKH